MKKGGKVKTVIVPSRDINQERIAVSRGEVFVGGCACYAKIVVCIR